MKPPKYTDNPARFAHVDLQHTNLWVTFERIRREQRRAQVEAQAVPPEHRVIPILKRRG